MPDDDARLVGHFVATARRFCSIVDSLSSMDRTDLLAEIYRILPKLIDQAISLPDVDLSDSNEQIEETSGATFSIKDRHNKQEWEQLCNPLKEKLGDWDFYRE